MEPANPIVIANYRYAVYTGYNESQGSWEKLRYNQNDVVTERATLMTKTHWELTNRDLDVIFIKGALKCI